MGSTEERQQAGTGVDRVTGPDDCVLNPGRRKGEPALPPTGILAVNPTDVRILEQLATRHCLKRHFLFHSRLYAGGEAGFFLAGPAVGAPMAVLCLEKLIGLGAENIILYGWCGSLVEEIVVGDIVVPTGHLSEEGTSVHYPVAGETEADPDLRRVLISLLDHSDESWHGGRCWTTDAPYRETRAKVRRYGASGIKVVDMEYSALCRVAAFRGVRLAAVFLVSDLLWQEPWKPGFVSRDFKQRSAGLLSLLTSGIGQGIPLNPAKP
ncbi:nucleoside phosphorylase [Desulfolithobacter sp.]